MLRVCFLVQCLVLWTVIVQGTDCPDGEVLHSCASCKHTCAAPQLDPNCHCEEGCACDFGSLRDHDGKCILNEDCQPPCNGDYGKVFNICGSICERTCENINDPDWKCEICGKVPACTCKPGLVKNFAGNCVKPEDCNKKCPPGSAYTECSYIPPEHQSSCENPTASDSYKSTCCLSGCRCFDGLVLNADGICVDVAECQESCDGDENAYFGNIPCGVVKKCSNLDEEGRFCIPENISQGCNCKTGSALYKGKCVSEKTCPKCAKRNESFLCRSCDTTCENMQLNGCYDSDCKEGCYCLRGFARNSDGECVRTDKCPENTSCGGDPNKMYEQCRLDCYNKCMASEDNTRCFECCGNYGRCICKPDFNADPNTGECIPKKPPPPDTEKCGKHEEYVKCPQLCTPGEKTCKMHFKGTEPTCVDDLQKCKPGCRCKKGYVRNSEKKCVKPKKCCDGIPNTEYVAKPNPCPGGTCAKPEHEKCDLKPRDYGCVCKKDFLKKSQDDATCVEVSSCPKPTEPTKPTKPTKPPCDDKPTEKPKPIKCGKNEYLVRCPQKCDPPRTTCEMYMKGETPDCVTQRPCKPACNCLPGYVTNSLGECVTPPECCEDPNSEFIAGYNSRTPGGTCQEPEYGDCDEDWMPFGCRCMNGYLKKSDKDLICVPICDCHLYD